MQAGSPYPEQIRGELFGIGDDQGPELVVVHEDEGQIRSQHCGGLVGQGHLEDFRDFVPRAGSFGQGRHVDEAFADGLHGVGKVAFRRLFGGLEGADVPAAGHVPEPWMTWMVLRQPVQDEPSLPVREHEQDAAVPEALGMGLVRGHDGQGQIAFVHYENPVRLRFRRHNHPHC